MKLMLQLNIKWNIEVKWYLIAFVILTFCLLRSKYSSSLFSSPVFWAISDWCGNDCLIFGNSFYINLFFIRPLFYTIRTAFNLMLMFLHTSSAASSGGYQVPLALIFLFLNAIIIIKLTKIKTIAIGRRMITIFEFFGCSFFSATNKV